MKLDYGVLNIILGAFLYAVSGSLVKLIPNVPATEITFFRCFIALIFCFLLLKNKSVSIFGNNKFLLLLRGVFGTIGLTTFYWTVQNLDYVIAITLQDLSSLFTILIAMIFLKEMPKRSQWLLFLMAIVGVVLTKMGGDSKEIYGSSSFDFVFLVGVASAFFSGCAYTVIRKLKNTENTFVIMFYFPLVATPVLGVYTLFNFKSLNLYESIIVLAIGVVTQLAQYCTTKAFQNKNAVIVVSISYINILFSYGIGYFGFGEKLNYIEFLGIGLVLTTAIASSFIASQKPVS